MPDNRILDLVDHRIRFLLPVEAGDELIRGSARRDPLLPDSVGRDGEFAVSPVCQADHIGQAQKKRKRCRVFRQGLVSGCPSGSGDLIDPKTDAFQITIISLHENLICMDGRFGSEHSALPLFKTCRSASALRHPGSNPHFKVFRIWALILAVSPVESAEVCGTAAQTSGVKK